MKYIKKLLEIPSFSQDGMNGFSFETDDKNISIDIEDVYKGHERYCINKKSTHIFYVLQGNGKFKINEEIYNVEIGDIIEIPKNTEFVYVGKMKLLLIMTPAFNKEDSIDGKKNDLIND